MTSDDFIDPNVEILARLIAIEHSLAVHWYVFGCTRADALGLPVTEVVSNFKAGVCGALLDGWRDVPPALRELIRDHATRTMDHAVDMARLNDKIVAAQKRAEDS